MHGQYRYEDAAEQRTITGWVCKTCHRIWGREKHMAHQCCAKDLPCECGGRAEKPYTQCKTCRDKQAAKRDDEQWAERYKSAVAWDGKTPLYSTTADEYFFDKDDLVDYIETDEESEVTSERIASLRLVLCEPDNGRCFDIMDFLEDHLPQDGEHDISEAEIEDTEKIVNDWIKKHAPYSLQPTSVPVTVESVRKR